MGWAALVFNKFPPRATLEIADMNLLLIVCVCSELNPVVVNYYRVGQFKYAEW